MPSVARGRQHGVRLYCGVRGAGGRQGTCNRETGVCNCDKQYGGVACELGASWFTVIIFDDAFPAGWRRCVGGWYPVALHPDTSSLPPVRCQLNAVKIAPATASA